jgi:3-oxoadipate enol-lactonase
MEFIAIDGCGLRYELIGSGRDTPLVLVHEMGGTLESWDEVLPKLSGSRSVLRYDTRGAGMSEKVRGNELTIDRMVDDLTGLMDAIGVRAPVSIAGCAVGGAIAVHFAARYPERCAALIAMSPATGLPPERKSSAIDRANAVEAGGMRSIVEGSMGNSYPEVLRGDAARFRKFRARWLGNDPGSFAAINRMLARTEMEGDFAAIKCPTLIIAGVHDALRPPVLMKQTAAKIAGAKYVELDTGHFMAVQTPPLVATAIDGFLKDVGI